MTSSVGKKKVDAAALSVSSTEAFPTTGLALQLEVPTVVVASIRGRGGVLEFWPGWPAGGGGGQYLPGGVGGQYPLASEAAQLWETRPSPWHHWWWARMRTM
jgi:hypothetical protein